MRGEGIFSQCQPMVIWAVVRIAGFNLSTIRQSQSRHAPGVAAQILHPVYPRSPPLTLPSVCHANVTPGVIASPFGLKSKTCIGPLDCKARISSDDHAWALLHVKTAAHGIRLLSGKELTNENVQNQAEVHNTRSCRNNASPRCSSWIGHSSIRSAPQKGRKERSTIRLDPKRTCSH